MDRRMPMSRMLHSTSGRQNFRFVRPTYNNPQQEMPQPDQSQVIQQQTQDAIKTATENNQTNKNDKANK
ncbi:hypothetical protein I4U23_023665 [Adineta vaga]|nr:hypothetical protein I4U23_023665 [Adineta vaga]